MAVSLWRCRCLKALLSPRKLIFLTLLLLLLLVSWQWHQLSSKAPGSLNSPITNQRDGKALGASNSPAINQRDIKAPGALNSLTIINQTEVKARQDRYLLYYCKTSCGGWADRLKGMVIGYVLATLTNRTFAIRVLDWPCGMTELLIPNEVPWDLSEDAVPTSEGVLYSKMDNSAFLKSVSSVDLDQVFTKRVALFKANLDYFDSLKANPRYTRQLSWMQPLTRDQIFAVLFRRLFRLSPRVQAAVERSVARTGLQKKDGGHLLCAHVRFASNAEVFRDSVKRHTADHAATVLRFLQSLDPGHPSYNVSLTSQALTSPVTSQGLRVFVTSDSQQYMDEARRMWGSRFVATDGHVLHVDQVKAGQRRGEDCGDVVKVVVDQQLLATCDVLVVSKSGLSRQAAYLRGTDRGLFCLLMSGQLLPCKASRLRDLYQVLG